MQTNITIKMEKILPVLKERLLVVNKMKEFVKQFKALRTNEERIIFTLNIIFEHDIIPEVYGDRKDPERSEELRHQGNTVFVVNPLTSQSCVSALKLYTASIAYAPCSSMQLALAYGNRSAMLKQICKYEECIRDIDRALALTYPDNLRFKLYVRKVECLDALDHSNVDDTVEEAQQWLENMSLDDKTRKLCGEKLTSMKQTLNSRNSKKENAIRRRSECPLPEIQTRNTEIPCASDAVTIRYNEQYGRHVVAARKINPGEVIAIEPAYSLMLSQENQYTHCSNCLEVSWANIPCDYCVHAMYCSAECKALNWQHTHDLECSVFPFMLEMGFTNLNLFSLKLTIQAIRESSSIQELREELKKVDCCDDPRTKGFSENGIFESDKYRSLLSLVTHAEKCSFDELFKSSVDASFSVYFLATYTDLFGSPPKDLFALTKNTDVTFVGGLILRHLQMILCNAHTFAEEHGLNSIERGSAVMPFLSLINHSCISNIQRHSRPKHMVIYAIYPIEKGEQILDSYSGHYAGIPKVVRQHELLMHYYFKCHCIACQEDWPLYYNLKSFRKLVKTKKNENKIKRLLRKYKSYDYLADKGDVIDKPYIVDDLLRIIQVLYDLVPMPCKEINEVVETLKRVYDLHGNKREIPKLESEKFDGVIFM